MTAHQAHLPTPKGTLCAQCGVLLSLQGPQSLRRLEVKTDDDGVIHSTSNWICADRDGCEDRGPAPTTIEALQVELAAAYVLIKDQGEQLAKLRAQLANGGAR